MIFLTNLQFLESHNKASKLKVVKKSKIHAFDFFQIVSCSFMLFMCGIVVSVKKRCPLFLKKSHSRYYFFSSQNEASKSKMAPAASTRRPRVNIKKEETNSSFVVTFSEILILPCS